MNRVTSDPVRDAIRAHDPRLIAERLCAHGVALFCDSECVDSVGDYRSLLEQLRELTRGAFDWQHLDLVEEGDLRRIVLCCDGQTFTATLSGQTDYVDDKIFDVLCNRVLAARGHDARLRCLDVGRGQALFVAWLTPTDFDALAAAGLAEGLRGTAGGAGLIFDTGTEGASWVAALDRGRRLAAACSAGLVIWHTASSREVQRLPFAGGAHSLLVDESARRLYLGDGRGAVHVLDLDTLEPLRQRTIFDHPVVALGLGNRTLAVGAGAASGNLVVLDAATLERRVELAGNDGSPLAVAVWPDGKRVAAGDEESTVHIWDGAQGHELARFRQGRDGSCHIQALALSRDGRWLVVVSDLGGGSLRDAASLEPVSPVRGGWCCAFAADSERFLAGDLEEACLYDTTGTLLGSTRVFPDEHCGLGNLTSLQWSEDGAMFAAADERGHAGLFPSSLLTTAPSE